MTTIGYGDVGFDKRSSYWFLCFYVLMSVMLFIAVLGIFTGIQKQRQDRARRDELLNTPLDRKSINDMDPNDDGEIDKGEYLEFMLLRWGKVKKEDTFPIMAKFDELDQDGSGFLDENDIPRHLR